ncbi:MAG: hypothetical protein AAFV53_26340 [Myxococcota bacterium]
MADSDTPLSSSLVAAGLKQPQQSVALGSALTLPDGTSAPAWLVYAEHTVLLTGVSETADEAGEMASVTIDLGAAADLRYIRGYVSDRIEVAGQSFEVPFGRGERTREAIGRARIRARALHAEGPSPIGPFINLSDGLQRLWLTTALAEDEPVIAWLSTTRPHTFSYGVGGKTTAPYRLLITADRAALVAISELGDLAMQPLDRAPIQISENRLTRDVAAIGETKWSLSMGGADRLRPLQRLTALRRPQRLREAARLMALYGTNAARQQAAGLLHALRRTDPLDRLSLAQLSDDVAAFEDVMEALTVTDADAGRLAEWLRRWEVPLEPARQLLAAALSVLPPEKAAWALPLHRRIRDMQLACDDDLFVQAEVDMELAEHLLMAGRQAEALSILEPRRERLPDESLQSVLPPVDALLTAGEGGQPLHIRVLELLARARGAPDRPDASALAELARHQPLLKARLAALQDVDDPFLPTRAAEALKALKPDGFIPTDTDAPPPMLTAFDDDQLNLLHHPVAREGGALGRLQAVLAKVSPPDHGTIRDYCEKVSAKRYPQVTAAIADSCVALGMSVVPAFISVGERRVGMRSYEVPEPFLLIGGDHLDPEQDAYLRPGELRAAIATELTHLRFKHSRITSSDLWAGVWDKSATALETTAILLPFMKYLPLDFLGKQRTVDMVRRVVPLSWLQRIYGVDNAGELASAMGENIGKIGEAAGDTISDLTGKVDGVKETAEKLMPAKPPTPREAGDIGLDAERILATHRAMQLTADRAALVLSGDLSGTLRSMFLMHSRLSPELSVAERAGLHAALARTGPDRRPLLPDLTVRAAALIAFYLSDDYDRLIANRADTAGA